MLYHIWEVDKNGERIEHIQLLSKNKKQLKGKWEIFVKKTIAEEVDPVEVKGYFMITDCAYYAVYDDRNERVFKNK
jgi:hypothetical protein